MGKPRWGGRLRCAMHGKKPLVSLAWLSRWLHGAAVYLLLCAIALLFLLMLLFYPTRGLLCVLFLLFLALIGFVCF